MLAYYSYKFRLQLEKLTKGPNGWSSVGLKFRPSISANVDGIRMMWT